MEEAEEIRDRLRNQYGPSRRSESINDFRKEARSSQGGGGQSIHICKMSCRRSGLHQHEIGGGERTEAERARRRGRVNRSISPVAVVGSVLKC
jgi:hypothetical protein